VIWLQTYELRCRKCFNAFRYSGTEIGTKGRQRLSIKRQQRAIAPDRSILDGCPDGGRRASDICDLIPRSEDH
jgi:hypothetical protein